MATQNKQKDLNFKMHMIGIASASRALEYRKAHPHIQDNEVIKYITSIMNEIIKQCDA